ncbi:hypothetical protein QTP88_015010 [Uroleucon formosanum]
MSSTNNNVCAFSVSKWLASVTWVTLWRRPTPKGFQQACCTAWSGCGAVGRHPGIAEGAAGCTEGRRRTVKDRPTIRENTDGYCSSSWLRWLPFMDYEVAATEVDRLID